MKCIRKIMIGLAFQLRWLVVLLLLLGIEHGTVAQEVSVNAQMDTARALIGDQVRLTLQAKHDKNTVLSWPLVGDTVTSKIEVISIGPIDSLVIGNEVSQSQEIFITSFDSGFFVIPPFVFALEGDSSSVFETEALLIQVTSIPVDTTQAIKDIKEPMGAPITFAEAWPYILGGMLLVGLIVLGVLYWKRKKKIPVPVVFQKPAIPPHELALAKLKELENKKLWQKDKVKDYHTELTDIIREYIEKRHGIIAMELTSDEILRSYSGLGLDTSSLELLRQVLKLADMVKFAKARPLANEHSLSMANAYALVKEGVPGEINTEIQPPEPKDSK